MARKKIKHLLIVESPFQLLNAFEALNKFKAEKKTILVRFSDNIRNNKQMEDTIEILEIGKLAEIKRIKINVLNRNIIDLIKMVYLKISYILAPIIYDKIFIGNYDSKFIHFIIRFGKQTILLDDGFKTLSIQKNFTDKTHYDWFSIFNFEVFSTQKLLKNDYQFLNKKIKFEDQKSSEIILFIGSKLSEVGIITEEYNFSLVSKIANQYINKKILYITHRGESEQKINRIKSISNITVKNIDYPIELFFLFNKLKPLNIISFYSTALITLKKIYKVPTFAYKFNYNNSSYKKNIDLAYKYCAQELEIIEEENFNSL